MTAGPARAVGQGGGSDRPGAWSPASRARLRRELGERGAGPVVVQLRSPRLSIDGALRALRGVDAGSALLWEPPTGAAFAASGSAAQLAVDGGGLPGLRARAQELWSRVRCVELDERAGPSARLFGGAAFAPRAAAAAPWTAYGDGWFHLPRLRYALLDGHGWLAVAAEGGPADIELAEAALEALEAGAALDGPPLLGDDGASAARSASPAATPPDLLIDPLAAPRWAAMIDEILAGIAGGRFEKVVAARRAEVVAARPFDPLAVLARLRAAAAGCVRFAVARGGAAFLGVTPEQLVARGGDVVRTEALAGSIAASNGGEADDDAHAAARLLASAKDRGEHALVVREIVRRLAPLCERLDVPAAPRTRRLRHLLHLLTPIEGRLRSPTHVLDLAAALHPTPAVAGLPVEAALGWIIEREAAGRGWYAGPIGWFDASGDGDLRVALRCAVVEGARAWLWTGAGIVAGSSAAGEYAETALKQRAILGGLGIGGGAG